MDQILLIFLAFLAGEGLIFLLVRRVHAYFVRRGAVSPWDQAGRSALALALGLPVVYSLVAAIGVILLLATIRLQAPELVGASPQQNTPWVATSLPDTALELTPPAGTSPAEEEPLETLPASTAEPTSEPRATLEDATPTPDPNLAPAETTGSPPSGKIVYICQLFKVAARDQICQIRPDGTGYQRLTTDDQADYGYPSLAPDGESVVYVGKEGESEFFQVFEIDFNGNVQQLTDEDAHASAPAISPDGERIVYSRLTLVGDNSIWVMDREGEDAQQLFGPPQGHAWDPAWSPDGEWILFMSSRDGSPQIHVMDAAGGNLTRITNLEGLRGRSDWSPDGSVIASYVGEAWEREIMLVDLDGANARLITNGGNNLSPSFSPDSQWIVFTSYRDLYRDDLGCEIYIMRRSGTDIRRLTFNDICDYQPRWGP